jgi:hypothetical protein
MAVDDALVAAVDRVASAYQAKQIALAGRAANVVVGLWRGVNPASMSASWGGVSVAAFTTVQRAQFVMAANADPYIESVAGAFGGVSLTDAPLTAGAFAGVASDGRSLAGLLLTGPVTAKQAIAAGFSEGDAMDAGAAALRTAVETQVAEAGSMANMVSMFMRDTVPPSWANIQSDNGRTMIRGDDGSVKPYFRPAKYVRMCQGGACSRCVVLAGSVYYNDTAFARHPRCHCVNIPVDEDVAGYKATNPKEWFDSLSDEARVKTFGKAGADAIEAGADMSQVVNARRGMYVTKGGLEATTEGTTKRGLFGVSNGNYSASALSRGVTLKRMMPEEIFRLANGNREEAIRLLRQYSYIR